MKKPGVLTLHKNGVLVILSDIFHTTFTGTVISVFTFSVSVPEVNEVDATGLLREAVPGQSYIQTAAVSKVTCILAAS